MNLACNRKYQAKHSNQYQDQSPSASQSKGLSQVWHGPWTCIVHLILRASSPPGNFRCSSQDRIPQLCVPGSILTMFYLHLQSTLGYPPVILGKRALNLMAVPPISNKYLLLPGQPYRLHCCHPGHCSRAVWLHPSLSVDRLEEPKLTV